MTWTSPRTWVAGETVTAAIMNTHVRDNLKAIGDPWTSYTPVWSSSGTAVALNNGTITGSYMQAGKTVMFQVALSFGSTTTFGTGTYFISFPVSPVVGGGSGLNVGGLLFDNSAVTRHPLAAVAQDSTKFFLLDTTSGSVVAPAVPWAWATGDSLTMTGVYQAA